MRVVVNDNKLAMAQYAEEEGKRKILDAIREKGKAVITLSSGLSQVDMLACLTADRDIPWRKVEVFPLAEYVGLRSDHPSCFTAFLKKNFTDKVEGVGAFHTIEGNAEDIDAEVKRLNGLMEGKTIDVAFVGIGENGHIAFNDPPADIETSVPFIRVALERRCRRQLANEGWFRSESDVPPYGITMSLRQILKARSIIAVVPDMRKATAVAKCMFDEATPYAPCAMLRWSPDCQLCLDRQSATLIFGDMRSPR